MESMDKPKIMSVVPLGEGRRRAKMEIDGKSIPTSVVVVDADKKDATNMNVFRNMVKFTEARIARGKANA